MIPPKVEYKLTLLGFSLGLLFVEFGCGLRSTSLKSSAPALRSIRGLLASQNIAPRRLSYKPQPPDSREMPRGPIVNLPEAGTGRWGHGADSSKDEVNAYGSALRPSHSSGFWLDPQRPSPSCKLCRRFAKTKTREPSSRKARHQPNGRLLKENALTASGNKPMYVNHLLWITYVRQ